MIFIDDEELGIIINMPVLEAVCYTEKRIIDEIYNGGINNSISNTFTYIITVVKYKNQVQGININVTGSTATTEDWAKENIYSAYGELITKHVLESHCDDGIYNIIGIGAIPVMEPEKTLVTRVTPYQLVPVKTIEDLEHVTGLTIDIENQDGLFGEYLKEYANV